MENLQYAEELVREYLVFRGFANTLQAFETELSTDIGKSFQVDKILDLIFSVYIPNFQVEKLVDLLGFFKQYLSSLTTIDSALYSTFSKLEVSVLRYYIVYALKAKRQDKVAEFFGVNGNELLQKTHDWTPWFAIPYIKNPQLDPDFRVFFSKEWCDALNLSLRNFFGEIFNGTPALLKISSDKNTVNSLKREIKQLNVKLSQYQALLEEKELELWQLKRSSSVIHKENLDQSKTILEVCSPATSALDETESTQPSNFSGRGRSQNEFSYARHIDDSTSSNPMRDENAADDVAEEFLDVKIQFQETFLGHTSPISCCRFSASGNNIASASLDGTVRIWTYESSTPASRNATIYCGAEVMSLDWDCKSDRLLLIGTSDGCIKAWNADAKRVVCDLNTSEAFPSILDLKCSPVEPIFVSAAASRSRDSSYLDMFASLTVWNMKTWKALTVLPLGEDPPAITSLCFNHNGKILAASASDGMIHMFDMSAGLQITGWPAHDSSISSILFGPEETSIFSLGSDGKIFEWSLQNQGQILWSRNSTGFCDPNTFKYCRHEMALDATGKRLLVTSNSSRSPIYEVRGQTRGWRTLPHSARVTTVDWHPTSPIFLTGSADNSVRVTSIS